MESKEIIALSDFEHVLERPTMYIGSVEKSEEKLPIIKDNKVVSITKNISVGFYKLLNEILDNSFDEAKRCGGKMKTIDIKVFTSTGRVIVTDSGDGFYKGYDTNKKTGVSNVETAMTQLRAGSNFYNKDSKTSVIGTNGVGASIVNMLSEKFEITTSDGKKTYRINWNNFQKDTYTLKDSNLKGTSVDFTPRKDIFKDCKWDKEILHTLFVFRNFNIKNDPLLKNLKFTAEIDNEVLDLDIPFYDKETSVEVETPIGRIILWKTFPSSDRISFINWQLCTGIHQKIVQEHLNLLFKDERAHEFYETFISLNLQPADVVFADQNKTKFVTGRHIIEPHYIKHFKNKIKNELTKSELYQEILELIKNRNDEGSMKKLSKLSKKKTITLSSKYYPSSKDQDILFLCEGDSAAGSLLQKRDSKTMGVYALRGKVKNARNIEDLSDNKEIAELIQIIGLDLNSKKEPKYKRIVIACDADADGAHITALLIHLFYKWFPYMLENQKVYKLVTPIVTGSIKNKQYRFYDLNEFYKSDKKFSNIKYLKGLGSLNVDDWEYVFNNLQLKQFIIDPETINAIEIAFGESSDSRKDWLLNDIE